MNKFVTSVLSASLLLSANSVVIAQEVLVAQTQTLETSWRDGAGYTDFSWLRSEGNRELYSSTVYIAVSGNSVDIYNTYNAAPLGQLARCGRLGCDLGRGQLIAELSVVPQGGNRYVVQSASQSASFLQGAQCRVAESYVQVFECFSLSGPNADLPSVFRFSPGS